MTYFPSVDVFLFYFLSYMNKVSKIKQYFILWFCSFFFCFLSIYSSSLVTSFWQNTHIHSVGCFLCPDTAQNNLMYFFVIFMYVSTCVFICCYLCTSFWLLETIRILSSDKTVRKHREFSARIDSFCFLSTNGLGNS